MVPRDAEAHAGHLPGAAGRGGGVRAQRAGAQGRQHHRGGPALRGPPGHRHARAPHQPNGRHHAPGQEEDALGT